MARTAVANRMEQRTFTTCNVFNGTSSQGVLTTNPTTATVNWTVTAWIKPTLPSSSMIFFNGNNTNGWGIGIGNGAGGSGSKLVGLSGTIAWINGGPTLTDGVWQHVALTRRNTRWFLYLNGVETDSGSTATVNLTTAGKASVGMQFSGANVPGIFYTGQIDFLRVWNVSLSKGQIFDNYTYDLVPPGCVLELEGTSGVDTSGNAVNATYTNTTTTTSNTSANVTRTAVSNRFKLRDMGTCLSFDGNTDYVTVTDNAVDLSVFTYAAWVKTRVNKEHTVRGDSKSSGTRAPKLKINVAGTLNLVEQGVNNMATSTGVVPLGVWTHIALTYDASGNYAFYINAVQCGTGTNLRSFQFGDLYVGASPDVGEDFSGLIDDFRVYGQALSATEISNIYLLGKSATNPTLWLKFDEGSGTTANDSSGNGYNGTITNATYSTNVALKPRTAV